MLSDRRKSAWAAQRTTNLRHAELPFRREWLQYSSRNSTLNSYPHVHGAPVLWKSGENDYNLYVWPEEDYLKAFLFDGQKFRTTPIGTSQPVDAANMSMPGACFRFVDGDSVKTAIIWASRPDPMTPRAVDGPFVNSFVGHDQQHFAYRDPNGIIWDEYYCPGCSDANGSYPWRLQQINCGQGSNNSCTFKKQDAVSNAPAADAGPFVVSYAEHDQQHFAFKSKNGGIWDVFYCPGCDNGPWHEQRVNMGSLTGAPPAVAGLFVNIFSGHDQQHFAYRAAKGEIWDVYYCRGCDNEPGMRNNSTAGQTATLLAASKIQTRRPAPQPPRMVPLLTPMWNTISSTLPIWERAARYGI